MGLQQAPTQTFATVPPGGQGIYEYSSTAKARLGQRMQVGDREFIYAKFATTIPQGHLVQGCSEADSEWEHKATARTMLPGTNVVTVTLTAAAAAVLSVAHEMDDGYLFVCTDPSATVPGGYMYQIKKQLSTVATSHAAGGIGLELYDNVVYTVSTGHLCGILKNPYNDVTTCVTNEGPALGVVAANCATKDTYGWIQNRGPACVFVGGKALEPYHQIVPAIAEDGAVEEVECTIAVSGTTSYTAAVATAMNQIDTMLTRQVIGVAWKAAGVATESALVLLNI